MKLLFYSLITIFMALSFLGKSQSNYAELNISRTSSGINDFSLVKINGVNVGKLNKCSKMNIKVRSIGKIKISFFDNFETARELLLAKGKIYYYSYESVVPSNGFFKEIDQIAFHSDCLEIEKYEEDSIVPLKFIYSGKVTLPKQINIVQNENNDKTLNNTTITKDSSVSNIGNQTKASNNLNINPNEKGKNDNHNVNNQKKKFSIQLFNDSIIYGDNFKLKCVEYLCLENNPNKKVCIEEEAYLDSVHYRKERVKFLNIGKDLYANTFKIDILSSDKYARCVQKGNINIFKAINYSKVKKNLYDADYPKSGSLQKSEGRLKGVTYFFYDTTYYYNKGTENIKVANYKNMMSDLSDHHQSREFLKMSHHSKVSAIIMFSTSILSIISAIPMYALSQNNVIPKPVIAIPIISFAGFLIGAKIKANDIDYYNRKALLFYNDIIDEN